jgi:hypothetical protein
MKVALTTVSLASVLMLASAALADQSELATARFGGWRATVMRDIDGKPPMLSDMNCEISTKGLAVQLNRNDVAYVRFFDEQAFSTQNVDRLVIGTTRYEVRSTPEPGPYLSDVDYDFGPDFVVISSFRGHSAVRRRPSDPFVRADTLIGELMAAKTAKIGFHPFPTSGHPERLWRTVSLKGLREAMSWCQNTFHSDAAYRLNPPAEAAAPPTR